MDFTMARVWPETEHADQDSAQERMYNIEEVERFSGHELGI